jgi:molybdate-binding protein
MRKKGEDPGSLGTHGIPVRTHMEVAYAVSLGAADVGFAIRAVAMELALDFIPLVEERFDLIVPESLIDDERCRRLLDTLSSGSFRRELDTLGYDATLCGKRVAEAVAV